MKKIFLLFLALICLCCLRGASAGHEFVTLDSVSEWSVAFKGLYAPASGGLAVDGNLFLRTGQYLSSLDPKSGKLEWKLDVGPDAPDSIAYESEKIWFITSTDSFSGASIHCFDIHKLRELWSKEEGAIFPSFAIWGKWLMYSGIADGNYSLIARTKDHGFGAYDLKVKQVYRNFVPANGLFIADVGNEMIYALRPDKGTPGWKFEMRGKAAAPAVYKDGLVYCADHRGNLYALDAANGAKKWSAALDSPSSFSPVLGPDYVLIQSNRGDLHSYNLKTGALAWKQSLGCGCQFAPIVCGNQIVAVTERLELVNIHAPSGKLLWKTVLPDAKLRQPFSDESLVYIPLNAALGSALLAVDPEAEGKHDKRNVLDALLSVTRLVQPQPVQPNPATQPPPQPQQAPIHTGTAAKLWDIDLQMPVETVGAPLVDDAVIYVTAGNALSAFDIRTGRAVWDRFTDFRAEHGAFLAQTESALVYAVPTQFGFSSETCLAAIAKKGNSIIFSDSYDFIHPTFKASNDAVYYCTVDRFSGKTQFIKRSLQTGEILWSLDGKQREFAFPAVSGSLIFVVYDKKTILALDLKDGSTVWDFVVEQPVHLPLLVYGNTLFAATGKNIYQFPAFQEQDAIKSDLDEIPLSMTAGMDCLLLGGSSGLVGLNAENLHPLWKAHADLSCQPMIVGDRAVAGLRNAKLLTLSVMSGDNAMEVPLDGEASLLAAGDSRLAVVIKLKTNRTRISLLTLSSLTVEESAAANNEELRRKLAELKQLYDDGLIPEDMYRKKVQELLNSYK